MLAYPIAEAEELLTTRLEAARSSLANCEEDLDFLREQITVRTSTFPGLRITVLRADWKCADARGRHGQSVQLGRGAAAEGESRGRGQEPGRGG